MKPTPPDRPDFSDVEKAFEEMQDALEGGQEFVGVAQDALKLHVGAAIKKARRDALSFALVVIAVASFGMAALTASVCGVLYAFGVI